MAKVCPELEKLSYAVDGDTHLCPNDEQARNLCAHLEFCTECQQLYTYLIAEALRRAQEGLPFDPRVFPRAVIDPSRKLLAASEEKKH